MDMSSIKKLSSGQLMLSLVCAVFISSCATNTMSVTEKTAAYDQYIADEKLEQMDRITSFKFDSWSSLGQEHLIISTTFNKPYLIKLRQKCMNLRFAHVIKINNTGSTLNAKFDSISVPGTMGIKCFIKSIHKLDKEQKTALRKIGREEEA